MLQASPHRRTSGAVAVNGHDWTSRAGAGNYFDPLWPDSYTLATTAESPVAWALYQVPGLEDERPVMLHCAAAAAPSVPGGGADLPLSYWVGISNYTHYAWEWHGPFTAAADIVLNSAEVRDRCISADCGFAYVIATASTAGLVGAGNPGGLTAARIEQCTVTTAGMLGGGYKSTRPHFAQFTTGAKGGSGLDPARQWVRLSWLHIEDLHGLNMQASYYRIDRKGPDDEDFVEIGGGAAPLEEFTDTFENGIAIGQVVPGATFTYGLRAYNLAGWTPYDYASYTIPLLAPAGLSASQGLYPDKVRLAWTAAEGASGYLIYRDDNSGTAYASVGQVESFEDLAVTPGETHNYWVRPVNKYLPEGGEMSGCEGWAGTAPIVVFSASPPSGIAPLTVRFDSSQSYDPDGGTIISHIWDWENDGVLDFDAGASTSALHQFPPGVFTVSLRLEDEEGEVGYGTVTIAVNARPIADLAGTPPGGDAPLTVDFDATGSTDPDGTIVNYLFDCDSDGVWDANNSTGKAQFTYSTPGYHEAKVQVRDNDGATAVASMIIEITGAGSWHIFTVASAGYTGETPCLAIVGGVPAISYQDQSGTESHLAFVLASDALGTSWNSPVIVDPSDWSGSRSSLAVVNGNPAIAYEFFDGNYRVGYVRSDSPDGSAWGTRINIGTASTTGYPSLCVVDGAPAVAMYSTSTIHFSRALDADGATWGSPVDVHLGYYPAMAVLNGEPAIISKSGIVQALDASGLAWGPVITAHGSDANLVIVNGRPATDYVNSTADTLGFNRALNSDGTAWGNPLTVVSNVQAADVSMAVVDSRPAMCYRNEANGYLTFVQAVDASGTAWNAPVVIDLESDAVEGSLCDVGGHPAIAYFDMLDDDLRFAIRY